MRFVHEVGSFSAPLFLFSLFSLFPSWFKKLLFRCFWGRRKEAGDKEEDDLLGVVVVSLEEEEENEEEQGRPLTQPSSPPSPALPP